jgi:hypothetical protein
VHLGDFAQAVEQVRARESGGRRRCCRPGGAPLFQQADVGAGDVAHVREIAPLVEVADAHQRRRARGDGGQLAGEADETNSLDWPGPTWFEGRATMASSRWCAALEQGGVSAAALSTP